MIIPENYTIDQIIVARRLTEIFGEGGSKAIHSILSDNTVISGGFLVQILSGKTWQNSDIDIFTTKKIELEQVTAAGDKCAVRLHDLEEQDDDAYEGTIPHLKSIHKYSYKGVNIDVIEVANIKEAINSFDFPFLRNYYDGKRIVCLSPRSLISGQTEIDVNSNNSGSTCSKLVLKMRILARIEKYEKRGFIINVVDKELEKKSELVKQLAKGFEELLKIK